MARGKRRYAETLNVVDAHRAYESSNVTGAISRCCLHSESDMKPAGSSKTNGDRSSADRTSEWRPADNSRWYKDIESCHKKGAGRRNRLVQHRNPCPFRSHRQKRNSHASNLQATAATWRG